MNQTTSIPHVLIVEDEEILQKFLIYHVETAGYRATAISMGGDIFPTLQRDPADLILMDLGLPDGDGLTWTQQIRDTTNTPVVVLTGRQGDDDRIMALGLGADDYLTKPCDPRELLLRMRNILERGGYSGAAPSVPPPPPPRTAPQVAAEPSTPPTPPSLSRKGAGERRGDRRGDANRDRRSGGGRDRRQGPRRDKPQEKSPRIAVMAAAAVALVAAGAGLAWFLLSPDELPVAQQKSTPPMSQQSADATADTPPARQAPAPASAPASPTPAPASARTRAPSASATAPSASDSLSRSVVASPSSVEGDDAPTAPNAGAALELEGDRPVAATSYSWVLKAKCPQIPKVAWWRVRSHTEIVRYVNTRHAGDWQPYIKSWTGRLDKLRDILGRDSGIRTRTGETLKGAALQTYIDQTAQRVAAVNCLAKAAAEFEFRRSQLRN